MGGEGVDELLGIHGSWKRGGALGGGAMAFRDRQADAAVLAWERLIRKRKLRNELVYLGIGSFFMSFEIRDLVDVCIFGSDGLISA